MTDEEREITQYMLNAIELQLTWPYSEEDKKELRAQRDLLIMKLQADDLTINEEIIKDDKE